MFFFSKIKSHTEELEKLNSKMDLLEKHIAEQESLIQTLKSSLEQLMQDVSVVRRNIRLLNEHDSSAQDGETSATAKTVSGEGYFELNRDDVFIELLPEMTPKCAFVARHIDNRSNAMYFELCNLQRVKSYDNIIYAVSFAEGSCTLASAAAFKSQSPGEAVLDSDGLWHIKKRAVVLLLS